ncbi:dynamin-related protein 4C-like [Elaeis guineensis]|uniref:Dynamin-related protein 4C-like n=1 Tax=Elaeis guineensis var. tenera TaxID=51953 RepID=A0A6I9QXU6_ELAGV|nr:dynamin-related protein 4C-like [Elaeis guineensis]
MTDKLIKKNRGHRKKEMAKAEATNMTALAASYDDRIRPILDAIDRLRHLKVMQEGIELPTIVVVGDQSSGKSSVLESLAGINLPRGQGICTRVPLIMRLQDHPSLSQPQLQLEYKDKTITTSETGITNAIRAATDEIAGNGKGISNTPLTLVVKKSGVPDLTMVDLPGITRVPVHGQPENIYEKISDIIMEYITPKESIILNVLSATVDFPTCESIRMSQQVDRTGERTLAVVTKADKAPEGLLEKVTTDDVNIGLGYVCVRNRVGDESYEQARDAEKRLFETHPLLSRIDKSIVGIPVLAQRLMQIQAAIISKCLPDIVKKINEKLSRNASELQQMPQNLSSMTDAMRAFMHMISMAKESLRKILIGGEFDEFPDDMGMHGTARMSEMLAKYSKELPSKCPSSDERFLMEEIAVLGEAKGINGLPNFLPRTAFLILLRRKVKEISHTPSEFVRKMWAYIEDVVLRVLLHHSEDYPQLQSLTRRAAENLIEKMRNRSYDVMKVSIEMEMVADYTSNPDYMKTWTELMNNRDDFMNAIENHAKPTKLLLKGFGEVEIHHLRQYAAMAEQAFDMRMRITAYWRSVVLRLVDNLALHILYSVNCLVEKEIEMELVDELVGPRMSGLERMLEESPSTAGKRERLRKSIALLKESKQVVAKIMDRIEAHGD